jgi:hypothetical protein
VNTRQQSTTNYPIQFLMVSSSDHVTAVTGVIPVVRLSKNGGAFGLASGAVAEVAFGEYTLAGNAFDRNTLGELNLFASGLACDNAYLKYNIVPWDQFGNSLSTESVSGIWARTKGELAGVPSISSSMEDKVQWMFTLARNKITQSSGVQTVRDDGDSATIASGVLSDDGLLFTRGKFM